MVQKNWALLCELVHRRAQTFMRCPGCKRRPIGLPLMHSLRTEVRNAETHDEDHHHRLGIGYVAAPAFTQAATAAPYERRDVGQIDQGYNGTYQGYPLREWYRDDSW